MNFNKLSFSILGLFLITGLNDQTNAQNNPSKSDLLQSYSWRAIGPANMGGRVTDIDGVPGDPSTFYVSGADGGIHKTIDGGVSFEPISKIKELIPLGL